MFSLLMIILLEYLWTNKKNKYSVIGSMLAEKPGT